MALVRRLLPGLLSISLVVSACGATGGQAHPASPSGTLRLYTSVTQDTVDAVLAAYRRAYPAVSVEVFRAPSGELDARIAAERREGRIRADLLWGTDPPSAHRYAEQGLLASVAELELDAVPSEYRTETFVGTRILNMVIVARADLAAPPRTWLELADPDRAQAVAIPDPGFAGSALGALGYFGLADDYGIDYYRALRSNGAVQVQSPGDVVTGVAEGRYDAGMTLDNTARAAVEAGSPVQLIWPQPGAVTMYSPIGVFSGAENREAAESFVTFVVGREAQQAIAETGWQPIRDDVEWPHSGPVLWPDWERVFEESDRLLDEYRAIFGE